MNKTEFVEYISKNHDLKKNEAAKMLDIVIQSMTKALLSRDNIMLVGFGSFSVRRSAPTKRCNPKTGEPMDVPARDKIVFKSSKVLEDSL